MGDIYLHLLQDSLTEFSYDAELAGVSYRTDLHVHGIQVCEAPSQSYVFLSVALYNVFTESLICIMQLENLRMV